jgi:hypothetical protein
MLIERKFTVECLRLDAGRPYSDTKERARPGFEPGTSRTLSENHTPRPTSQIYLKAP